MSTTISPTKYDIAFQREKLQMFIHATPLQRKEAMKELLVKLTQLCPIGAELLTVGSHSGWFADFFEHVHPKSGQCKQSCRDMFADVLAVFPESQPETSAQ